MAADRALTIRPAALHCVTWTPGKGSFAPDVWPPRVHTWAPGKWIFAAVCAAVNSKAIQTINQTAERPSQRKKHDENN